MNKLEVCCDLDGVLADIHETVRLDLSAELGVPLYDNDCNSWLWIDKYGISEEELWKIYRDVWVTYKPSDIKPVEPDVSYLMSQLCQIANVDIVTAHIDSAEPNVRAWLKMNNIEYRTLRLHGYNDKTTLPYDAWIDDYPKTIQKVVNREKIGFYFRRAHNISVEIANSIRVSGLREVAEFINTYEFLKGSWIV